jgi:hypothetical protein
VNLPRTTKRLAALGASAAAVFALNAPVASAGQSQLIEGQYGSVTFDHYGEILTAYAGPYAGGRGVRAYLEWTDQGSHKTSVTALEGAGGTGKKSKNLSIREGTTVYLRMCYTNLQNEDYKCSKRQKGVA